MATESRSIKSNFTCECISTWLPTSGIRPGSWSEYGTKDLAASFSSFRTLSSHFEPTWPAALDISRTFLRSLSRSTENVSPPALAIDKDDSISLVDIGCCIGWRRMLSRRSEISGLEPVCWKFANDAVAPREQTVRNIANTITIERVWWIMMLLFFFSSRNRWDVLLLALETFLLWHERYWTYIELYTVNVDTVGIYVNRNAKNYDGIQ